MIRLIKHAADDCGCVTYKQVNRGVEVGGLVLIECPTHKAETDEIHERAMRDYRLRNAPSGAGSEGGSGCGEAVQPSGCF